MATVEKLVAAMEKNLGGGLGARLVVATMEDCNRSGSMQWK